MNPIQQQLQIYFALTLGWEGTTCSADINECNETLNECKNGATCINYPGSFTCACATGFTGQLCEADIDECKSSPCQNNGVCLNLIGEFECNCTGTGQYIQVI